MLVVLALFLAACLVFLLARRRAPFIIAGRVALVTGAGSGLGFEIARELASRGALLVLWDISVDGLRRSREAIDRFCPGSVLEVQAVDVSDEGEVEAAAARLGAALGPARHVSILVNNAGVVSGKPIDRLLPADVRRTVGVNLFAHFWTLRAFLPGMRARNDGAVLTMASAMALIGGAGLADYCASKWAVLGMHDSLVLELRKAGHTGVRATAVLPYATATGMFAGVFESPREWRIIRWLFPLLQPRAVARAAVRGLETGETLLVLPRVLRYAALLLRCLPTPLYMAGLEAAGGRHGMDTFRGRGAAPG